MPQEINMINTNVVQFFTKKNQKNKPSNWYSPIVTEKGTPLSGAAAMNYRVKMAGGQDVVVRRAGEIASAATLEMVNSQLNRGKSN